MSDTKLSLDLTGNAGMYYVCYQLSLQGWNAMPTTKNATGVDVVLYKKETNRSVSVQVKTKLAKAGPTDVPLYDVPRDVDAKKFLRKKVLGDFWVIVRLDEADTDDNADFPVYILPRGDIIDTLAVPPVSPDTKDNAYWLADKKKKYPDRDGYTDDKYKNAWDLIK